VPDLLTRFIAPTVLLFTTVAFAQSQDDPHLWLEEIQGERALAQVEAWNAATEADLTRMPRFEEVRARAKAILDDDNQIALPTAVHGDHVLNLWRDANNPRGLWRTASLDSYLIGDPKWRTLIDVDALGREEGTSWVWGGANCLAPEYRRCLVSLSPGGTDAVVVREFDVATGAFVQGGFELPEAKTNATWVDADRLLVVTDYGPDSLTTSGYGRIAKLWRRGTSLAQATTVFEGETSDVAAQVFSAIDGDTRHTFLRRGLTFWTGEVSILGENGRLVPTPLPVTANQRGLIGGRIIASLNQPLEAGGRTYPNGSIVAWPIADILAGRADAPELVMAPSKSQAIEEVAASDNVLWVKALEHVSGKLFALRRDAEGNWSREAMRLPENSTLQLRAVSGKRDLALVTVEGMLTPPSLHAVEPGSATRLVQSLPPQFASNSFNVEQRFATSSDGARIPYFLVRRKDVTGPVPALIHAYGGFRAAQTPTYLTEQPYRSGPLGLFWAEGGNAYVLANIRGGGEYGPAWHEAALRENRQLSFDDLHAVAEDLIADGIARPDSVAISGRSNGGVLVGAAANQRPDLYTAVISGSPLTDMRRYSQLLAGASWMGEYGNPDVPGDWAFMSLYSPYQNLKPDPRYPATFYYASTLDDRVHPGHARKMAARHAELGHRFYFREYREGGHSVGADRSEDAMRAALLLAFLNRELGVGR
jgi:prolyl oligopeptidase